MTSSAFGEAAAGHFRANHEGRPTPGREDGASITASTGGVSITIDRRDRARG
jgi:hypothetical protein